MSCFGLIAALLLTNATDVTKAIIEGRTGDTFELSGTLMLPYAHSCRIFAIADASGGTVLIRDLTPEKTLPDGTIIRCQGFVLRDDNHIPYAKCTNVTTVASGNIPEPTAVTIHDFRTGKFDFRSISLQGTIRETFRDEIDSKWIYLSIVDDNSSFYAVFCDDHTTPYAPKDLTGALVSVSGVSLPFDNGLRRILGRRLMIPNIDSIRIIQPPPSDPFSIPSLSEHEQYAPDDAFLSGRRLLSGRVIAVRNGNEILLRDKTGIAHLVRIQPGDPPKYGDSIEVAGLPETDLYRINLYDAKWRKIPSLPPQEDRPTDITVRDIFFDSSGNFTIKPIYYGCYVRLAGTIQDLPSTGMGQGTVILKSGGFSIPVDISANHNVIKSLAIGCEVTVAGTCIVETESWRPHASFPHATGITLVVRRPSDVTILSRPPWWTPQRLLVLISSLILALIAVIIWNRWLNRLVSRRSRALVKEQLALAEAELKVSERTRLAIELHDSLSQNLAAVACQVAATKSAVKVNADETMENLNTTERMLLSCRTELRRCLWDLRNDTLDEQNMTEVIRKVLAPVLGQAELQIRFNVSRARLDDSTLHSVICIIRELASNAMTHGQATRLTVAGDLDGEILAFSVNENGKGFDPGTCDGPAEGHFGLAGIRERIERLRGTFTLKSHPRKGSYTKITFRLPSNDVED